MGEPVGPARLGMHLSGRDQPRRGIARFVRYPKLVVGGTVLAVLLAVEAGLLPRAAQTGMSLGIHWLMAIAYAVVVITMPRSEARVWGMPLRWAMAGLAVALFVFAVLKTRAELG